MGRRQLEALSVPDGHHNDEQVLCGEEGEKEKTSS